MRLALCMCVSVSMYEWGENTHMWGFTCIWLPRIKLKYSTHVESILLAELSLKFCFIISFVFKTKNLEDVKGKSK